MRNLYYKIDLVSAEPIMARRPVSVLADRWHGRAKEKEQRLWHRHL